MAKIVLDDVAGGYNLSKINSNFQRIEDELNNKVLYRDNVIGEPNTLEDDLDANGKSIFNIQDIVANNLIVDGTNLDAQLQIAVDAAEDAAASADAAAQAVAASQFANYAGLRSYTGSSPTAYVTGYNALSAPRGVSGLFTRDDVDVATPDDGGTVIVDALGRRWKRMHNGEVHVKFFGAIGNNLTDDTAAINAAFAWLRDFPDPDPPITRPIRLVGHGGTYRCDGPIDASGINSGRTWEVDGLTIHSRAIGKTALDLTGMRFGHLRNVRVWGDAGFQPHTGILLARNANTCSNNVFDNVSTDGYFSTAAFTMYAAEVNQFNHCDFWNRRAPDGGGEAWAAILQGTDYKPMLSEFQTLSTGRQSFTVNQFNNCTIQKPFGFVGPTMFLQDMASVSFNSCYITNGGGSAIVWRLVTGFTPYRILMDFQQETTGTDRFIQFTSDIADAREILNLECRFGNVFCDQEIFAHDTLTTLTLRNFKCNLPRMASGVVLANGLFHPSTATITTLRDFDIVVPLFSHWGGPAAFAGLTGELTSMDGQYRVYTPQWVVVEQSAVAQPAHTGDLVEFTFKTITIPAGTMGKNGRLRIRALWSVNNNANAKNLKVRFGGVLYNSQTATSSLSGHYEVEIANRNSHTSQLGTSTGTTGLGNSGIVVTTSVLDTLIDQTIQLQCQLANAADSATLEGYCVEVARGE